MTEFALSQRHLFENELLKSHPKSWLDRARDGGYKSSIVEYMWAGFKIGFHVKTRAKLPTLGQYIIARVDDNGANAFSDFPYVHATDAAVFTEAKRLGRLHHKKFNIWKRIHAFDYTPLPVEEPNITVGEAINLIEELK